MVKNNVECTSRTGGGETSGIWIAKSFRKQSLGGTRWKCERNIKQTLYLVADDDLVVACLPFDPRFAGWNPAEDDAFLKAIKIRSTIPSEGK
jgi:hypothetical protein